MRNATSLQIHKTYMQALVLITFWVLLAILLMPMWSKPLLEKYYTAVYGVKVLPVKK